MKIVFVTTGLTIGGAEMQLVRDAHLLKAHGNDIRVISMLPPQAFEAELRRTGIPLDCLNMKRGIANPAAILKLAALIRRHQPDIVHAHMIHANLLARVTRLICRMPVLVCSAHNVYEISTREKVVKEYSFRDFLYRITDSLADVTTQICNAGAERYLRVKAVSSERMRVIYGGVDIDRFTPDAAVRSNKRRELGLNEEWAWLAVGRFEEAKDYPNLVEAFADLLRSSPSDRLFIVGGGSLRSAIEERCRVLGLKDAVTFLGQPKNVTDLMQAADGFVMSSMFEGLPSVLIEAHASGLPVVATRVGGIPEVVTDGDSGYLCEDKNPAALAAAMLRLRTQSEASLAVMRSRARAHILEKFSLDQAVARWENLYRELTGKTAAVKQ